MDEKKLDGCTINEKGSLVYPELTIEIYGEFTFKYYIEPRKEYEKLRFLSRDIYEILSITNPDIDKIIVITDIRSNLVPTERPENINFALREFAEAHSDMLISCQLYIIADTEEQAIIYQNTTFVELAIELVEAGFVDINEYCSFETSLPYVYRNEHSKELLRFLIRLRLRDNNINGVDVALRDAAEGWFFHLPEKFGLERKPGSETSNYNSANVDDIRGANAL